MAVLGPVETVPGRNVSSDEEIADKVRRLGIPTTYHPCCTAAMMPEALGEVVDANLRVYGTKGYKLSGLASNSEHDSGGALRAGLGKLRPELTKYEASATHDRRSMDSGNSRRVIIQKSMEWSISMDYDTRNASSRADDEQSQKR